MSIYKSAVSRPITTLMIFAALLVIGFYSLIQLPIDLYPEMEPPYISVMTSYPGANANDIENNVTRLLENQLNAVDNLKEITSVSYDNLSIVSLEFEWESNLDEAANDIRDAIDMIEDYMPEDCENPVIFKFNFTMIPVVFYAVTAEESYPGIEKILDEKIINPLNRIDGIASIGLMGVPRRKIYVDVNPSRLDAYNLTVEQIGGIIRAENLNTPSGNVRMGQMDYQLRVEGEFTESEQLNDIVVGNQNGKSIYLRDVAVVRDTIKDLTIEEKINGKPGLRLFIMKQSGVNTVKIARDVTAKMEELKATLPPDVKISTIMDTSDFIKGSINNLSKTLMYAFVFVVLVVLFFLGRWRATLIIVLTIPISLIVSFIYLFLTDNSINIISLTSLSIAIGMVVDDAIVVLENISTHVDRGSTPREAAIYATNEVWVAVIVTTLVIVAVFFPLTLISGMTGVLFKQLGWIVTITVVTSTLTAITLTPMLSSKLLRLRYKKKKTRLLSYDRTFRKVFEAIESLYINTLKWALRHKLIVSVFAFLIFITSMMLAGKVGGDFLPEADESRVMATIELQTGLRVEETLKTAKKIEKIIEERYPEVIVYAESAGSDDEGTMFSLFSQTGSNIINFTMRLLNVDERERDVWTIADDFRDQLSQFPEVINYTVATSSSGMGMGSENNVAVEIFGYDFDNTNKLATEVAQRIELIPGARDIQISREKDKPELKIILDQQKLSQHGLNTATVSMSIRNQVAGMTATLFREEGEEYDIIIRLKENFRNSITDIENITIVNPIGQRIKLSELASIDEYWSPPNIERKRRERLVTVTAVPSGVSLGELAESIQAEVNNIEIPPEMMIGVGGAFEDMEEAFVDLALLLLMSLILVYLVMASQFESFIMPAIIMISIPFAFTGVIIALYLTNTTLSVIAALGAVLLVGIVVKNGIVLVDYTNLLRDRGHELYEAITLSGKSRLRPVLMTAFTTILAMTPLALSTGEGSEIWSPMGLSLIGGLIVSTFITLIMVPVFYAILGRWMVRHKKEKVLAKYKFLDSRKNQIEKELTTQNA
ncbi:efflux RND transporter permease subunit [Bacteroidota bacterium]